jgi:hypothetical protein
MVKGLRQCVTGDSLLLALIITYIKNTWHIGKKLM